MREDPTVRAALAYYGFTPSWEGVPEGMTVERVEGEGDPELGRKLLKKVRWTEHTGTLSGVPRLSPRDVAALLGVDEDSALKAMLGAAWIESGLAVIRVRYREEERFLLVKVV